MYIGSLRKRSKIQVKSLQQPVSVRLSIRSQLVCPRRVAAVASICSCTSNISQTKYSFQRFLKIIPSLSAAIHATHVLSLLFLHHQSRLLGSAC
jgi:hypothetical protein